MDALVEPVSRPMSSGPNQTATTRESGENYREEMVGVTSFFHTPRGRGLPCRALSD
jgi:hypothetical protein